MTHWEINFVVNYHRNWLLSACAYNMQQQENMCLAKSMHLTGSMRLIKSAKTRVERPTTLSKKRSESVMYLSMVYPTSPTWGRWGNGGGFFLWISYFASYMGHNYRVLPPSTPLSPISDCSNIYCGESKKPNKHRFSTFLVSVQFWQMPHLARSMGPDFNDNIRPHVCPIHALGGGGGA